MEIGDLLHSRYEIVDKLGYGGWSTVWLANDYQSTHFVAVKVGMADSLRREATILGALSAAPHSKSPDYIPRLLDEFILKGPNGSHPCYVTPLALCNLRQSSYSRLFPVDVAQALAYELTLAVAFVHSLNRAIELRLSKFYNLTGCSNGRKKPLKQVNVLSSYASLRFLHDIYGWMEFDKQVYSVNEELFLQ